MKRWIAALTLVATLAGCGGPSSSDQADDNQEGNEVAATDSNGPLGFCRHVTSATDGGNTLMQSAFSMTKGGTDFGSAPLVEGLLKQGGYHFIGAEPIDETCWAYAEMKGTQWDKPFHLKWRCPVKAYRDNPNEPGAEVLEMVENEKCDFNVSPGDPGQQVVEVKALKLS